MFMNGVVREVYRRLNGVGVKMSEDGEREWLLSQLLFFQRYCSSDRIGRAAQCLVRDFGRECKRRKLRVNVYKSKVMSVGGSEDPSILNITLNGERVEVVNSFKYLGSFFSSKGGVKGVLMIVDFGTSLGTYAYSNPTLHTT